jgi:catechol 2,3-dioxygenase-like lactoylglutathione lyase family enzyme
MRLNQVTVPATDLERSIEFYKRIGLRLIVHSDNSYARFECPDGDSTFSLHHVDQPVPSHGVVVYFEFEDLDLAVSSHKEKGLKFISGPFDMKWLWREARLADPDGNVICLFEAGENRRNPPWRRQND